LSITRNRNGLRDLVALCIFLTFRLQLLVAEALLAPAIGKSMLL
jgi:hypothetical protein